MSEKRIKIIYKLQITYISVNSAQREGFSLGVLNDEAASATTAYCQGKNVTSCIGPASHQIHQSSKGWGGVGSGKNKYRVSIPQRSTSCSTAWKIQFFLELFLSMPTVKFHDSDSLESMPGDKENKILKQETYYYY